MLASDRFAAEVREDEQTARGLGINAVPTFVVDRRIGGLRRAAARGPARAAPARRAGQLTSISPPSANGGTSSIRSPLQKRPGSYQLAGRLLGSRPICW